MGERPGRTQSIGDGPIQQEYVLMMDAVAEAVHEMFNGQVPISEAKTGFVLLVFAKGEPDGTHRCNYISNASREDVKTLLREQLAYFEGMPSSTSGKG